MSDDVKLYSVKQVKSEMRRGRHVYGITLLDLKVRIKDIRKRGTVKYMEGRSYVTEKWLMLKDLEIEGGF